MVCLLSEGKVGWTFGTYLNKFLRLHRQRESGKYVPAHLHVVVAFVCYKMTYVCFTMNPSIRSSQIHPLKVKVGARLHPFRK